MQWAEIPSVHERRIRRFCALLSSVRQHTGNLAEVIGHRFVPIEGPRVGQAGLLS